MSQTLLPRHTRRLANLVHRPGGMTEGEAVAAATANLDAIRDSTLVAIDATIDSMHVIGRSLAVRRDPAALKTLYATSNTVMGVAGAFGLSGVSAVAYSLCELIDRMQNSGSWSLQSISIHLDCLRVTRRPETEEREMLQMRAALRTLVNRVPADPVAVLDLEKIGA